MESLDQVFGPDSGQERLYNQAVSPIVEEVLEGFNCTIFAYGQTGTGKTYTMEGGDRDSADGHDLSEVAGVIPRAIHQIFTTLDGNDSEYTVKCRLYYCLIFREPFQFIYSRVG